MARRLTISLAWPRVLVLLLTATAAIAALAAPAPTYLLGGAPATVATPMRDCEATDLLRLEQVEIPAPPEGWSGQPQAVNVFNVFAGEVMIRLGDRMVCGRTHDARTRDSRFRAGVGLVVVPVAGSHDPLRIGWGPPVKSHWIPSIRVGGPSPLQQEDTLRLVVRTSCIAIALALAFSALMGFVGARDRTFLAHAAMCLTLLLWQATLNGLTGFPAPWLPVDGHETRWQIALSALAFGAMLGGMYAQSGAARLWPRLHRRVQRYGLWPFFLLAGLGIVLPSGALRAVWRLADNGFFVGALALVGISVLAMRRGRRGAFAVITAALPFMTLFLTPLSAHPVVVEFRTEAIQLALTWFLVVMAYTLTNRYDQLRTQRDAMRELALTDPLTGLANRRAGLARLDEAFIEARRTPAPLSVGFVDVDLFKRINDAHGHEVGDRVLVAVADVLAAEVRRPDDVVRMGGEEFLVLLPGVEGAGARARLEAIRSRIGDLAGMLDVPGLQLTASIGLATLGADDDDAASLLRRADEAMYRAKHAGRDQVVDDCPDAATPTTR